jgi:UDP:flavonoid glycosyltransferase YjiC (YdhE family)
VRILFTGGPAYGLTLPVVPLVWAARAAGHEVLFASASQMVEVGSRAGLPMVDVFPDRERWDVVMGPALSPGGASAEQVAFEVVLAGDIEVESLPGNVRPAGYLPLSAFLPTTSLLVHHGGSGTTAAPLHYGVPQLVLPSFADNPLSAQRVVERGVGLSHEPATITVGGVRDMVRRLLDEPEFVVNARAVADEMAGQASPSDVLQRAVSKARTE